MRVLLVVGLLVMAGCIAPTPTSRSDQVVIDILASGHWVVELPLPSDDWIDGRWQDVIRLSQGNATFSFIDGEHPLRIAGDGAANLEAFGRWERPSCCLLDFNQAMWTTGDADDGHLSYVVVQGDVHSISIAYAASACQGDGCDDGEGPFEVCSLETRAIATGTLQGPAMFPRQPVSRTCIE